MNTQKNITESKSNTIQAASNETGKAGKVLVDNRIMKPFVSTPLAPVAQLVSGKSKAKPKPNYAKKQRQQELRYSLNPLLRHADVLDSIKESVEKAKRHFKIIQEQIDDDEDLDWIENKLNTLNKYKKEASKTYREIRATPEGNRRSTNKNRSQLIDVLNGYKFSTYKVVMEIYKAFPLHTGGFGAKGRAHAIDTEFVTNTKVPSGKTLNNHFLNDITIDGKTNNENVYKATPKVAKEKSGPLQILGKSYNSNGLKKKDKKELLTDVDEPLNNIFTPQNVSFTNTPAGKDRGLGQYANMNNTNAAGYAWLLDVPGAESQRWEWLHVRGAGIGGATDSTNLVAGTRDANTQMIPFESNIRALATAVGNNKDKYSRLQVKWSVTTQIATHAYNWIRIAWVLFKKNGNIQTEGEAYFQPLHTGSNISKSEVEKLETALQEARNKL